MYIKTTGKPSKVTSKLCKESVKFYGKLLLSNCLYHKLSVKIDFYQFDKTVNDYAYCEFISKNNRTKDFIISIDRNLSKKEMLCALAHEMVHVKQYAKGELKDYIKVNKCKWNGKVIYLDKVDYWWHPWEIEARGTEMALYVNYVDHLKNIKHINRKKNMKG